MGGSNPSSPPAGIEPTHSVIRLRFQRAVGTRSINGILYLMSGTAWNLFFAEDEEVRQRALIRARVPATGLGRVAGEEEELLLWLKPRDPVEIRSDIGSGQVTTFFHVWRTPRDREEIRSGAIMPDEAVPGRYLVEANTAQGLRKFCQARELTPTDPQSEGGPRRLKPRRRSAELMWGSVPISTVFIVRGGMSPPPDRPQAPAPIEQDPPTTQEILAGLRRDDLSPEEKRRLVIEAEVLPFDPGQVDDLKVLLRKYIEQGRDSDLPADLIAVTSAIRKYVAIIDRDELRSVGFLLDAGHRAPVPLEIELEVAKMVVRKLTANPPENPDPDPLLAARLMELARAYLNDRLLPREKYGAVALNSVLSLVLLRSSQLGVLFDLLRGIRLSWFKQLVARRARRLQQELSRRLPEDRCKPHVDGLDSLIRVLQQQTA